MYPLWHLCIRLDQTVLSLHTLQVLRQECDSNKSICNCVAPVTCSLSVASAVIVQWHWQMQETAHGSNFDSWCHPCNLSHHCLVCCFMFCVNCLLCCDHGLKLLGPASIWSSLLFFTFICVFSFSSFFASLFSYNVFILSIPLIDWLWEHCTTSFAHKQKKQILPLIAFSSLCDSASMLLHQHYVS